MTANNKPFILKFKTENNYYIYDVNTNHIVTVDSSVFELMDYYECFDSSRETLYKRLPQNLRANKNTYSKIETIFDLRDKYNLFSCNHPKKMKYFASDQEVQQTLTDKVNSLVLNVTERCNFRCKYCIFSGEYFYRRSHSKRQMSLRTAIKAVDFLKDHSSAAENLSVTFYGGEPLLNYNLIESVISYCKDKFSQGVLHSLTTNASLLDDEKIDYFIKNSVYLVISIDGPEVLHDRYRRDIKGRKTFRKVLNVIKKISNLDPEYYYSHVSFSSVVPHPLWFGEYYDFLKENPLFINNTILLSSIEYDDTGLSPKHFLPDESCHSYLVPEEEFIKSVLERYASNKKIHPIFDDQHNLRLSLFHKRCHHFLGDTIGANGLCLPGYRKLFVNVDGTFGMCERVPQYDIGSLHDGLDITRIKDLTKKYISVSSDCFKCPVVRFCLLCFQHALRKDIDINRKRIFCEYEKKDFERTLILYCSILEKNPKALDFLINVKSS